MNSGTIDPSVFATKWQSMARQAKDADCEHTTFIKGTSNRQEVADSFRQSVNSWKPAYKKDRVEIGNHHRSPDGGMRDLARSRGKY